MLPIGADNLVGALLLRSRNLYRQASSRRHPQVGVTLPDVTFPDEAQDVVPLVMAVTLGNRLELASDRLFPLCRYAIDSNFD